eukprot:TRINITY_DN1032_c0_g5_i1.p1 TRINITY_DN1032_c0_g5~~TRINITY_DN1032_c0_g5_i1.p1  ORF type:complete len:183 (+),score=31.11 TRINITY_DN1032_c0_g5_i1:185-733(+)
MSECPYLKETGSCPVPACPMCTSQVSDKAKAKAEKAKADGNAAFKNNDLGVALRHYALAVNLDPANHVYRSNRSATYSGLGQFKEALDDAQKTIELKPDWGKGYSRAGLAFRGLRYFHFAAESYQRAITLGEDTTANRSSLEEAKTLALESGFSKDDETRVLAEQQDAEKQAKMAEMGCCVM